MSTFGTSGNIFNTFGNQNNNPNQQSGSIFSIGQGGNDKKSNGSIFGTTSGIFNNQSQNNAGGSFSIFNNSNKPINQNNSTNPIMATPAKVNNSNSVASNIFGLVNNTNSNSTLFGNTLNNNFQNSTQNVGGNLNTNQNPNLFGNNQIVSNTSTDIFKSNINQNIGANQKNNLFNTNQQNNQMGLFSRQGTQNQINTNQTNNSLDNIFNLGNNQQANSQINQQQNNLSGSNQNTGNSNTNGLFQNPENIQKEQNSLKNLFQTGIYNQNTNQTNTQSLFGGQSTGTTNANDNQNKEIKILDPIKQPGGNMFGIQNPNNQMDSSNTGKAFQSVSVLFGNTSKIDNTLTSSLFSSINPEATNKGLFSNSSNQVNPVGASSDNKLQFISAPSNILGINLDTLSDSVKKAYKNENKSIKDFIREVEQDFQKDNQHGYNKKISNLYSQVGTGFQGLVDFHDRRKHINNGNFQASKEKYSEFDYYQNYRVHNLKSSLNRDRKFLFLQNKRLKSPEKEKDYNFNRNIIELSLKVKKNSGSGGKTFYKSEIYDEHRNNENESENLAPNFIPDISLDELNQKYEIPNGGTNKNKVIEIFVEYNSKKKDKFNIPLNINMNNYVSLLKELLIEKLKHMEDPTFESLKIQNLILIKQNTLMKDDRLIKEYNLSNGDKITMAVSKDEEDEYEYLNLHERIGKQSKKEYFHSKNIKQIEVAPLEKLPKLTKQGYKTYPDFKILCRMTLEELKNVYNFSIWNEYGKIEWKDKVDLTDLDLDEIVNIEPLIIELYGGEKNELPKKGEKLNKPAKYILEKIQPEKELRTEKDKKTFEKLLKNVVREKNGNFIEYNHTTSQLIFECEELNKKKCI